MNCPCWYISLKGSLNSRRQIFDASVHAAKNICDICALLKKCIQCIRMRISVVIKRNTLKLSILIGSEMFPRTFCLKKNFVMQ